MMTLDEMEAAVAELRQLVFSYQDASSDALDLAARIDSGDCDSSDWDELHELNDELDSISDEIAQIADALGWDANDILSEIS